MNSTDNKSLYEVAKDLVAVSCESRRRDMVDHLNVLQQVGRISLEVRQRFLDMAERDLDGAVDQVFGLYSSYKEGEKTRAGMGIREGVGGRLMFPMHYGEEKKLEGIYTGCGDLLSQYTVDATGFDSRMFMRMWREDIIEGTVLIKKELSEPGDNVVKRALGENPSKRDIVLFTIAALIRTRSKRRTKKDIVGGWWNVLTGKHKRVDEFGRGANLCSTEAIVAQLLSKLYGIEGELKLTRIRADKPSEPHNYFQVDDYPGDGRGPIIDVSGCPHLLGFVRDPLKYSAEIENGRAWLKARRAQRKKNS